MGMIIRLLTVWVLVGLAVGTATAATQTNQSIAFNIMAINELSVSGNPGALTINSAFAGSEPNSVSDNSTSYSFTTNQSNRKITGSIDRNMPANTTLKVALSVTSGWASSGTTILSTSPQTLATGGSSRAKGLQITYTLEASVAAGEVNGVRTVTLTLTSQ